MGGLHMNIHKLMQNVLFECELYCGQALMSADPEVRKAAEMNLKGCFQKRQLEASKFVWMDGMQQLLDGEWARATDAFKAAASKMDGWGWGVNNGEIWIAAAACRMIEAARLHRCQGILIACPHTLCRIL